jgi:hypothetical protein
MPADAVKYLNDGNPPAFFSRLLDLLQRSKQSKAPASQWLPMIEAFTQKGVKKAELEESGALAFLASLNSADVLTKDALIEEIRRRHYTVKEVLLGSPKYPSYRQPGGEYREYLYIANSERDNVQDALDEVNFEMEELAFNPELALLQPELIVRLEKRREMLMSKVSDAIEFTGHHFHDKIQGRYGKNLLAHCRVSIHGDTYFIDEIQSDWAQRGRRYDWKGIVRGPLVTSTEAWAGMVLRRQMQIAASMPGIKRLAWITESMRNGGRQDLEAEVAKETQRKTYRDYLKSEVEQRLASIGADRMTDEERAAARRLLEPAIAQEAARRGLSEPADMLNDFYIAVLPKLADKALAKSGAKTGFQEFVLDKVRSTGSYGSGVVEQPNVVKVPAIEFTPQVKDILSAPQPLYSRAPVRVGPVDLDAREKEIARAIARTEEMLGSARHLRFARHVYDVATGHRVAGRYVNRLIQVSLGAADIVEATEHECFHFATDNLLTWQEVEMLRTEFARGGELNAAVRCALKARGMGEAASQCDDPMEAAAHGFTLWARGYLDVGTARSQGLFSDLVNLARDCVAWFKRTVLQQRCTSVEEVFEALSSGSLAEHRTTQWRTSQEDSAEAEVASRARQRVAG